ncbi:hypothetical protein [Streptomyces sp. NPDC057325]|uniref:hypothetical protein n=1 Tax=unclassified Streptomyces TaxID=2593676 RepID=UPI003632B736
MVGDRHHQDAGAGAAGAPAAAHPAGRTSFPVGPAAPVSRALACVPGAVVGGSSLVVCGVIAVMGAERPHRADPSGTGSTAAAPALAAGPPPLLTPGPCDGFPGRARTVLGSGVVAGTPTAVLLTAPLGRSGLRDGDPDPDGAKTGVPEPRRPG